MISVAEAIDFITRETGRLTAEAIDIVNAVGRILAEDIVADSDLPPFDRSQMDGYAVVAKDTKNAPVTLKIVGESSAGHGWHHKMGPGEAVRIMTGAPVPNGADAVQKVELTDESVGAVVITEPVPEGRHIVYKGSETRRGEIVILAGVIITTNMVASLAAFGYAAVRVSAKPRIAIFSTGSEIVEIDKAPGLDQIRNSNSVMLRALAEACGGAPTIFPIAVDDLEALKERLADAVESSDIVIITGGVSVGKYDLTKLALHELGARIHFERVALKPGKPAVFASIGKTLVFGLPGNPVSAAVTFYLFVREAILRMQGAAVTGLRKGNAVLAADARAARERDTYLPSSLETTKLGQLSANPLKWQGSSDFIGFARADSLIFVPSGKTLTSGEVVEIVYL